ncbi:hypothetical protein BV372_00545 [Nostoc sp. T09]|nr:hypothetical protein BV372_00545 [Nostoc sp. T09]
MIGLIGTVAVTHFETDSQAFGLVSYSYISQKLQLAFITVVISMYLCLTLNENLFSTKQKNNYFNIKPI